VPESNCATTTDHDRIRQWAEERGGRPAKVAGTDDIRIDFPSFPGEEEESLQLISWEEFFDRFEEENLVFMFRDEQWLA
jgi:hypothetical protein